MTRYNDPAPVIDETAVFKKISENLSKLTGDEAIDSLLRKCIETLEVKGNDYTAGRGAVDRLYNFRTAAEKFGISMEQVWAVYAYKHWTAIERYAKQGQVESEPIEGRIMDMINYLLLLNCIIKSKG